MPIAQLVGNEAHEKSKTFVFEGEGHTLGNTLRCVISTYKNVEFCGYTVPHPADTKMHFRIQMRTGNAIDALRKGLKDIVKLCDHTVQTFETEMYKTD